MQQLVYPRERTLGAITLVLGLIAWLALIVGTLGIALLILALGFVAYLFAQSALIAHIKGNGVELSEAQFPDLYAQFAECCERLQLDKRPQAYILSGNGALNAFATKFLGTQYVVLLSEVVDAMSKHDDGVRFYIGHELGHLRMKHLNGHLLRWPVLWLPLLGAAYSRARESTCDRHGLACSSSPENAARALAALSAGSERWQDLDIAAYRRQVKHSTGFWMSFHELVAAYPWLTKRAARVLDTEAQLPSRNAFAYLPALFVPYGGRMGAGFSVIIMVYVVAVLAAIAVPQFMEYQTRGYMVGIVQQSQPLLAKVGAYYEAKQSIPASLEEVGVASTLQDGSELSLDSENMVITVGTKHGPVIFYPSEGDKGSIIWYCAAGEGLKEAVLPKSCKEQQAEP